jgi:hypothetical protein
MVLARKLGKRSDIKTVHFCAIPVQKPLFSLGKLFIGRRFKETICKFEEGFFPACVFSQKVRNKPICQHTVIWPVKRVVVVK